jgi:alanine racemase
MHLEMVRVGILLYGLSPSTFCNAIKNGFHPAMTLKTRIVQVKEMERDQSVSYGRTFITSRKSLIATLPIGYADGYSRALSNRGIVLIHGKRYPIAGTVCMDICMADVTASVYDDRTGSQESGTVPPVQAGDEAVLFGKQGEAFLDIDEIALLRKTINYEVTCNIGKRVPRAYFKNGKLERGKNNLV